MLRRLARLIVFLIILWLGIWGVASFAASRLADQAIAYATRGLERFGVTVDSIAFADISIAPTLLGATVTDVRAAFDLAPAAAPRLSSEFQSRRVAVSVDRLSRLTCRLEIDAFEISFHETDRPRRFPFDRLTDADLRIGDLPILAPRRALRAVRDGLDSMWIDNLPVADFELDGVVMVEVRGQLFPTRLYTEPHRGRFRLRFDRDDVQTVVDQAKIDLSPEQVEIISLYPVRLPFLIDITRRARTLAWDAYPDQRYQRDALRHVVWSYMLTQEFGSDFAKEVTDAQETRPGNTAAERAMDYHNNAVGRRWATSGTPLALLPDLVASDPDVIRDPGEVDSRRELLR